MQPGTAPGKVQVFLTDCNSAPFGTRASGGNPASGDTFDTIGYFSNPSKNVITATPPIVVDAGDEDHHPHLRALIASTRRTRSRRPASPAPAAPRAVVLARADSFPDALAGTPLAAAKSAPLLLTGSASLDSRTMAEIQRVLTPGKTVFLLGGSVALSPSIANTLGAAGYADRALRGRRSLRHRGANRA